MLIFAGLPPALYAQDAREIVRKSVELDQGNFSRAGDYTWSARRVERQLDSEGKVKSERTEAWETIVLYGEPHRKFIERNGKPLSTDELRKQQEKLDKSVAALRNESPQQKQHRLAGQEKQRRQSREFLLEIPEIYDLRIEREQMAGGRPVWVISATPKPGYRPKRADAKPLLQIKGRIWIDKNSYQWVRLEAETIGTISFGLFIARLSPGAKLIFEQARINDEIWLPERMYMRGAGRLMGLKKIAQEEEVTWSDYRKFRVESNIKIE